MKNTEAKQELLDYNWDCLEAGICTICGSKLMKSVYSNEDLLVDMSKSYEGDYREEQKSGPPRVEFNFIWDNEAEVKCLKLDPDWDLRIEPLKRGFFRVYKNLLDVCLYLKFIPFSKESSGERFFCISKRSSYLAEGIGPIHIKTMKEIPSSTWPDEDLFFMLSGRVSLMELLSMSISLELLE